MTEEELKIEIGRMHNLKCNLWKKATIYLLKYNYIQDYDFIESICDLDKHLLEPMYENDRFVMALENARGEFIHESKKILEDYKKGEMGDYII